MDKKYDAQIKQFGQRIRELRADSFLTQAQLAEKAGISERTIQRIEAGEISVGLDVIIAIGVAFNMKPYELLTQITFNKKKG